MYLAVMFAKGVWWMVPLSANFGLKVGVSLKPEKRQENGLKNNLLLYQKSANVGAGIPSFPDMLSMPPVD